MEKQKKAKDNSALLRADGIASDIYMGSEPVETASNQIIDIDYEDSEAAYFPIKYPAFENAFRSFIEELGLYSVFDQNDSISFELAERIEPENLLKRIIKRNNAEADIKKINTRIGSYVEKFKNALKEIGRMEKENASAPEIEKSKGNLFASIVMEFDAETEEFGDFTYEFALKRLYMDLMQTANMNGKHGWEIFDYFTMSKAGPEYRQRIYEELIGNIYSN
jgi:hypothetical protein